MSKIGFIQVQRQSEELLECDPDAYLLMSQIMFRALRKESKFNKYNLSINQALIGDYKTIGLTEQRYRDAKDRIQNTYKMATFKGTNKGTVATLLNIEFCDINSDCENEQKNGQRTDKERTENGQRTTKEEVISNKKEKEISNDISLVADAPKKKISSKRKKIEPEPKIERDKDIFISETAHKKLVSSKGSEEIVKEIYSEISVWKAEHGISGGNDYATANKWSLKPKNLQSIQSSKVDVDRNRKLAFFLSSKWFSPHYKISISENYIEFVASGSCSGLSERIYFNSIHFEVDVMDQIKTKKFEGVKAAV